MTRLGQAMLNAIALASTVEEMLARWLPLIGGAEAVSELLAVVGQNLGDAERSGAALINRLRKAWACLADFAGSIST